MQFIFNEKKIPQKTFFDFICGKIKILKFDLLFRF